MNLKGVKIDAISVGIGGVLGAAVGATGSWLLLRRVVLARTQAEFEERLNNEVAAAKSHYNNKLKQHLAGGMGATPPPDEGADPVETAVGRQPERAPRVDYSKYAPPSPSDPRLEGLDDDEGDQHVDAAGTEDVGGEIQRNVFEDHASGTGPHIRRVNREEFGEVPPGFVSETLTWYAADKVLCDEKDEPVRNPMPLIGAEAPTFGYLTDDPAICLIVNEEMDLCLEIILNEGSYADAILGYGKPK